MSDIQKSLQEQAKKFDDLYPIQKIRAVAALKDLDEQNKRLSAIRDSFNWGIISEIICIGEEYQIVEYESNIKSENKKIIYHIYINYKDIGITEETLDKAIITALCYKYEGANSDASYYICKMLSMDKEE